MLFSIFMKGLLLGIGIAAPVGPIGLLCIRRTLTQGRWIGWLSGCGAATADACYGAVAAFGLSAITNQFTANSFALQLVGGLFLCYLGAKAFFAKPQSHSSTPNSSPTNASTDSPNRDTTPLHRRPLHRNTTTSATRFKGLLPAYTTTFALTLANPATIASFIGIFSGLGITQSDYRQSVTLVSGVFSGSLLWWLVLVSGVAYLGSRLTPEHLDRFNWVSGKIFGVVFIAFGMVALFALPNA
ncbi:MAG: LysE family transporter [Cyanobacteria bacterium J06581_3]